MRKIISIVTVSALFSLFSISPVLAEETETIDLGTGTETVVETIVEIPAAEEPIVETVVEIPAAEEPVIETVVEIPTAEDPNVETIQESPAAVEEVPAETIQENVEYQDSGVLNVIVPITVSIMIDPLELAGKGQVYSDVYDIKNYGDNDVILTFTDISVTFAEGASIEPSAQPFEGLTGSASKSIFMMLDFGRSDVPPAIITDPNQSKEISIPLSATLGEITDDSFVQLNFSGSVNEFSALDWHDNDVTITMNYTLVAVPPPAEEVTPAAVEVMLPAEETATPVEETATPVEETATPAEETATPVEETVTPAEETATPAEETATPAEETATPAESPPETPAPAESPGEPST